MNVPHEVLEHKTLMIALLACADGAAQELGLEPGMSVAAMARVLEANRTSVYEQKIRLVSALTDLAATGPGRPPAASDAHEPCDCPEPALTVRVLEFRVRHLDAVVEHANRTSYSATFRRFILDELDRWHGSTARFAEASRVPADTLKDWVDADRAGLASSPPAKPHPEVPVDASETTRSIVADYEKWEGATKYFLRVAALRYGITTNQVAKVLRICGALAPRPRHPFRHRGSTVPLLPGSMLVTDGKTLDIELTGSGTRMRMNWQGMVDQTTGCDTAVVVTDEEDAVGVRRAFVDSLEFLGGVAPDGLLHDNKPCYQEAEFCNEVVQAGTILVPATLGRPENKAVLEGEFSLFEARVGTVRLDDTSTDTLVRSAVGEAVRAYTAATNAVPRIELGGMSRLEVVRSARPTFAQQAADRAFIRRLKARHERQRSSNWREKIKLASRRLLDHVFASLELEGLDAEGNLREYLSIYEPAAIRQAAVIVSGCLDRGELQRAYAHRYLTKVIQSKQVELDLWRQESELLELCRLEAQDWVSQEQAEYDELRRECEPDALACALAERAAPGGLPVEGAFWTEKLLQLLECAQHLVEHVRRFLIRLYEAPPERRLSLIDRICALECGIV